MGILVASGCFVDGWPRLGSSGIISGVPDIELRSSVNMSYDWVLLALYAL